MTQLSLFTPAPAPWEKPAPVASVAPALPYRRILACNPDEARAIAAGAMSFATFSHGCIQYGPVLILARGLSSSLGNRPAEIVARAEFWACVDMSAIRRAHADGEVPVAYQRRGVRMGHLTEMVRNPRAEDGRWCWLLKDIVPLPKPIPHAGMHAGLHLVKSAEIEAALNQV